MSHHTVNFVTKLPEQAPGLNDEYNITFITVNKPWNCIVYTGINKSDLPEDNL
jgi:hypothetical protein